MPTVRTRTATPLEKYHAMRLADEWVLIYRQQIDAREFDSAGDEQETHQQLGLAGVFADRMRKELAGEVPAGYDAWLSGLTSAQRRELDRRLDYSRYDENFGVDVYLP